MSLSNAICYKTCPIDTREAAIECASNTHSEIVHIVGHTFVLYRRSKENKLGLKNENCDHRRVF